MVDTVSWRFLIRDLETLYKGGQLREKQTSYRQWTQALQDHPFTEDERSYWENLRQEAVKWNNKMPVPGASPVHSSFALSAEQTKSILRDCNRAYDTRVNE